VGGSGPADRPAAPVTVAERLAAYEVSSLPSDPVLTTWCLTHEASGSSLQTVCYYASNLDDEPRCVLTEARVIEC
jgi:hypothetical protein